VDAGVGDAAPDARDVDGQPRVQGARVDIGADESDGGIRPPLPLLIVRVRPDGNDAGDGATWATAKQTVQAAVDAAAPFGGEVWTAVGVYRETLTVPPYAYIYGGFAGGETRREQRDPRPGGAVLDGDGETVVSIPAGHRVSRLDGFLLRNGGRGGGIWTGASGPAIENNTILGAVFSGGAMTLRNNHVVGGVSGLAADISNNLVTGSLSDGISTGGSDVPTRVANNVVRGNGEDGIAIQGAADVVNNTVVGNGGAGFRSSQGRSLVANNIFAGNGMGISARDIYGRASSAIIAAWSNCLFNNGAKDWDGLPDQIGVNRNIGKDPLLAAPEYGDFHIQPASPCWGTGDNLSVMPGERDMDGQPRILGRAVDIGADETDGTTWNTGPARLYVRTDGSDGADGRTWATAMQTLSLAASGAPGGEVWVAAGTYAGAGLALNGVALYGGFSGTETQRDQRDPRANVTVLDGERKGSVVIVPPFAPETTVLDGFTVQNGSANHGGGVLLREVSRAVVSNNVIRNNTAIRGGGIMVESNAAPMISHNIITGNGSAGGGGIEFWTNGNGTVKDNVITGNSANFGPGIFASDAYGDTPGPFLYNNTIPDHVEIWIGNAVVTNNILGDNASLGAGRWTFNLLTAGGEAPTDANGNIFNPSAGFAQDYRLGPDSRAINAGDNAAVAAGDTDLGGKPRIADGRVDMGAYEYAPPGYTVGDAAAALRLAAGLSSAAPDLAARLNVDNTGMSKDVVNLADAIRLAALSVD
jgi:parallel beta-helix repeat protein